MEDREFTDQVAEILKAGLEEFFPETCKVTLAKPTEDDEEFEFDSQHVCISVVHNDKRLCQIELLDDHCLLHGPFGVKFGKSEPHEYCHPQFPNTVLFGLHRLLNRDERLARVQAEAVEIADADPTEALNYFVSECQNDPLLSRFISYKFADVLRFQCSDRRHKRTEVVAWINEQKLPEIAELCG